MTHLSFFTKYPTQGATSRYRSFAFAFRLSEMDYNIEIQSFMDNGYLKALFAKKSKNKIRIFLSYAERIIAVLRSADNLIIERELFPYLPYGFEKWFLKGKRYILDFDDNVWEDYRGKWLLENKYDQLVKNAAGVIVGNDFLHTYIEKLNTNIIKIPTVISLKQYQNNEEIAKFDRFSLVWIGSRVTYRYILAFASMFQALAQRIDFDLVIIASKSLSHEAIEGVSMRFYEWSSESEATLLRQSHVGIMPLDKDPFSQGKSGFKLIQYQAAGLPMVASPVGENRVIVRERKNGFLPHDTQGWIDAICKLHDNPEMYAMYAQNSYDHGYNYSIQKYFPLYQKFINTTFTKDNV
jgi:glycosyltransferase involved in cell wall biosynthesis